MELADELARHPADEGRMAASLVELERRPGHALLTSRPPWAWRR